MDADVIVIGAGITGVAVARELSRYDLKIILIDKRADIAFGQPTKANTGIIHAGYDDRPGTMKAELCSLGNSLWHSITKELNVPLREIGSLVVAQKEDDVSTLEELKRIGETNGVPDLEVIYDGEELREMEPNLSGGSIAALHAPSAAITSPFESAMIMAENAVKNGLQLLLETEVTGISGRTELTKVLTTKGPIETRYLVNAAGLDADRVSAMVGIKDFAIVPRKGEYYLFDKELKESVRHVLFPVPTSVGKGIVVTPTVDGNILIGPNSNEVKDKNDLATTQEGLDEVLKGALNLVPMLGEKKDKLITNFCGLRPESNTGDFIIKSYKELKGFVNVAGIKSPGLTAAPAIAQTVVGLLRESGLNLKEKHDFYPHGRSYESPIRELDERRIKDFIAKDSEYGRVVCRCEHVSQGDVVDAIRRGANTLDGVKLRTRAGMGRCQGGFCTHHLVKILSREMRIPVEEVTKRGKGSEILPYKAKEFLLRKDELNE
jgi:glycerol-3-phosphate dehydrogenase